jgi:dephospho-CoA kinase
MIKIAVFGKLGSGKSTVSRALASATGITLYQLDSIVYKKNGELVEREIYLEILALIVLITNSRRLRSDIGSVKYCRRISFRSLGLTWIGK